MKMMIAIALGVLVAGCDDAYAQSGYYTNDADADAVTLAAAHGPLTATNGMTLYTFGNDASGVSNCDAACAANWPPYVATAGEVAPGEGFTLIIRADGTGQWAKDGAPLYFWVGDTAPGDTTGDGIGGVWHIAQ